MNLIYIVLTLFGFDYIYHYNTETQIDKNSPLIITDYLNLGQVGLARELSKVEPFVGNIQSHSGFFTVSNDCVRNMFFWYFPAENGNTAAPLLVWLQGGPGSSSMYGLFSENGPYYVDSNYTIHLREKSWTKEYSVIFIDNPVGVGFSFSEPECYVTNETQVGEYLAIMMDQFFQLFPEMRANPLFITGESYAGKYVPAMVHAIHHWNQNNPMKMHLEGMAIGDGMCDPYHMMDYGTYLNKIGLIFDNQIARFDEIHRDLISKIESGEFAEASHDFSKTFRLFRELTGLTNYYDYYADYLPYDYYIKFISQRAQQLNAGNITFTDFSAPVYYGLYADRTMTMVPIVQEIINAGYKTLFFSGQFDVIVPYPLTSAFLKSMNWNGKEAFVESPQKIWYSQTGSKKVNGYVRSGGNVMQVIVRNAGHMVPLDQPDAALEMLRNFIYGLEF